jgi:Suppressor of fused protein (SUFU)
MPEPIQDESPALIEHMELCFGRIQRGFEPPTTGDAVDEVQFVECRGGFVRGVSVVSTLGLSRFALESSTSEKKIRQELFFMAKEDQLPDNAAAVLHQVVGHLTRTSKAVLRGHAIKRPGILFHKWDFVALYSTLPIYYPHEMWTCRSEGIEVVPCWLLPITEAERGFHARNGWSKFETLLNDARCDLFDLNRPSLV